MTASDIAWMQAGRRCNGLHSALCLPPCHGAIACFPALAMLAGRTCLGPGRALCAHHDNVHHIVPCKWRCFGLRWSAGLWLPLLLLGKAGCSLDGSRLALRA